MDVHRDDRVTRMDSVAVRAGRFLREALLTVAALGGVVCIALAALAFAGGYTLIMFKTGSMSPTIPAGSVALVQRVPASELELGDIATIDRPGALPVTHRVTGVSVGANVGERIVTMKGDANESEDPAPYTVTEARIVHGSLPHLADVIVWFGNPVVLGGITVGAAALVTWAFWPKQRRQQKDDDAGAQNALEDADLAAVPLTRRERRAAGIFAIAAFIAVAGSPLATPPPAHAAGTLHLSSDLSGTHILHAVDPLNWHLDVDASGAPADGSLTIALSGADATTGFEIIAEARSCASTWTGSGCAHGEKLLRAASPVALDGTWEQLLAVPTPSGVHLRVALTAAETTTGPEPASASLTVRAHAAGETVEAELNGEDALAGTGGTSWAIYAAPAAVLIGLGVAMSVRAHRGRAS
ncbi:S26 family signal peptidase [Microbacterium sp. M28]|uniref:S26 family signal peptidase n=1 Tax=Microbacterium sp. M28 TaxID=2962064 RepID=UPI0021F4655C|nr:S26 family signal peptidase [Microbacterium sp. M28]UYO95852.1 S26 family signal peptidase [Microbacterium sp. M28]